MGWVSVPSAHRSVSPVVVDLACTMTPNSSFCVPYCVFLIIVWFVPDFNLYV